MSSVNSVKISSLPTWSGRTGRSGAYSLLLTIFAVWVALAVIPALPEPLGVGIDPAWQYGLNLAHKLHLPFGSSIVFTYGPLGYLLWPDPGSIGYPEYFAFLFLSYALFLWTLNVVFKTAPNVLVGVAASLALVIADLFAFEDSAAVMLPLIGLSAVVLSRREWARVEFILASLCCGFLLLAKFNEGVITYACLVIIAVVKLWPKEERRKVQSVSSAVVGVVLPWALLVVGLLRQGAGWSPIVGYIRGSLSLASGYSLMMGLAGEPWQYWLGLISTISLFLLIPILARERAAIARGLLVAAPLAYFFFKHAMVRQDRDHAFSFHFLLASLVVFPLLCAASQWDRALLICFCLLNVEVGAAMLAENRPQVMQTAVTRVVLLSSFRSLQAAVDPAEFWRQLSLTNEAKLKVRVVPQPLDVAVGRQAIDVLPMDEDVVRANNWNWSPLPVFQSYAAFTPYLDQLNASCLRSSQAPPLILFSLEAIDQRLPPLDDVFSWRTLVDWYDIDSTYPPSLLLRRRSSARYTEPTRMSSLGTSWGEWVSVPDVSPTSFVVMRAAVTQSFRGRLNTLLSRSAPVYLEARSTDGEVSRIHVTWPNLVSGALITTLPQTPAEVREYFGVPRPGLRPRVSAIRFLSDQAADFAKDIPITFEKLTNSDSSFATNRSQTAPTLPLQPIWLPNQPSPAAAFASVRSSASGLDVRPQTIDPQLIFQSNSQLSSFKTIVVRAKFGVADRIDLFFGKQVDGRGVPGFVPVANQWLDVYIDVAANPYWDKEAGNSLRFDPASNRGVGSVIEIKGVWASLASLAGVGDAGMTFYPAPVQ